MLYFFLLLDSKIIVEDGEGKICSGQVDCGECDGGEFVTDAWSLVVPQQVPLQLPLARRLELTDIAGKTVKKHFAELEIFLELNRLLHFELLGLKN